MKKSIFNDNNTCPCCAKKDLEVSNNVYTFLEDFLGDIETFNWEKENSNNIGCTYCLIQSALNIMRCNKWKYGKHKINTLIDAENRIAKYFLKKILN